MRVDARCWRSMRKSQDPHNLHVEIGDDKLSESYCTCKTGRNNLNPFLRPFWTTIQSRVRMKLRYYQEFFLNIKFRKHVEPYVWMQDVGGQ
jgi:hypothetical protein